MNTPTKYDGPFQKVRFTKGAESTAGLIFPCAKIENLSIPDISRFFPYSEARKMGKIQFSPSFKTWDEAFAYVFPS